MMRILKTFVAALVIGLNSCVPAQAAHKIEWVSKPCLKPVEGIDWDTCNDLEVKIDDNHLLVEKDFKTDLASIPRFLWPWIAPNEAKFVYPAVLHDFLYRCPDGIPRVFADQVFYDALIQEGVGTFRALRMYYALRIFGGSHFNNMENCPYNFVWNHKKFKWKP